MEREFTNALSNTPLWRFALTVYPHHQQALLAWQDEAGANVNRLLLFAYCQRNRCNLAADGFESPALNRLEELIKRVRLVRKTQRGAARVSLKSFELELEGLHLQLLDTLAQWPSDGTDRHPPDVVITRYEVQLGIKKGALAPFIATLAN
ncbi:hypothetical protein MED297_05384 [Reinekea sp. MED297]|uniref:TIGR02444 family protein n=2 Tax=Reinekea TaxID=230494 RepID=A4BKU5_9GAMM|nr:hypothetical protein MED297_05384 [Reinekea sp. MED297] [Reinekea blandensis MED297]